MRGHFKALVKRKYVNSNMEENKEYVSAAKKMNSKDQQKIIIKIVTSQVEIFNDQLHLLNLALVVFVS